MRTTLLTILIAASSVGSVLGQVKTSFGTTTFKVIGATPGGRVCVYSVALQPSNGGSTRVLQRKLLTAADASGAATFDLKESVPFQSIWFITDLSSGSFAVVAPPGFSPGKLDISPPHRGRNADDFSVNRPFLLVCVVRPGLGAWDGHATDGKDDADGSADGKTAIGLDRLAGFDVRLPVPALSRIAARDVLFVVDPLWMRYGVVQASGGTNAP